MRLLLSCVLGVLVLCGTYYAGYSRGQRRVNSPARAAVHGESERMSVTARKPESVDSDSLPAQDYQALMSRDLVLPLDGMNASSIHDTFNEGRATGKRHEATDIMASRGTPIHAVEDGVIKKLFLSKAGGNTIYQFDPQEVYCFYYAHLDRYADGLKEGMPVKKGDVIGYVGSTGDASPDAPHLHLGIAKLRPDKHWWEGTWINPYPILMQLARNNAR